VRAALPEAERLLGDLLDEVRKETTWETRSSWSAASSPRGPSRPWRWGRRSGGTWRSGRC